MPGKHIFLSEQVSHHPPITAFYNKGDSGFLRYTTLRLKSKFTRGGFVFSNMYKEYLEFLPHNEKFEFVPPLKSIHNLIIGTPYIELQGKSFLHNCACPKEQYAEISYFKRGWSEASYHRVTAQIFSAPGQVAYKIEGRWSDTVTLINAKTGATELVWKKQQYPANSDFMYGMSHYHLQMNYLPNSLRPQLPPTDTRFRPDQRALENGDFKLANSEKNRLEDK